jgi:hypothetical protein
MFLAMATTTVNRLMEMGQWQWGNSGDRSMDQWQWQWGNSNSNRTVLWQWQWATIDRLIGFYITAQNIHNSGF